LNLIYYLLSAFAIITSLSSICNQTCRNTHDSGQKLLHIWRSGYNQVLLMVEVCWETLSRREKAPGRASQSGHRFVSRGYAYKGPCLTDVSSLFLQQSKTSHVYTLEPKNKTINITVYDVTSLYEFYNTFPHYNMMHK